VYRDGAASSSGSSQKYNVIYKQKREESMGDKIM
jgi:hypothetical protein